MQTDNTSNLAGALCVDQSRSLQTLETAAASVTPPWLVVDSHRTPRVSKACDECRTRKVKCNGGQPCQPCEVRRLSCHYRVNCRRRKNAAFYAKKKLQTIGTTQPPVDDIVTRGHHTDIAEGVYATESLHSPGSLQLFYGPSSNFFLLQRIHHHLGPPTGMIDSLPAGPDEARNGLDRFKYRGLFFGRSLGDPESPIASSDPFENSRLQVKWSLLTSFLPGNLAAEFLGRFIRMELPFLSFVDAFYVQNSIQAAYEAPTSPVSLPEYIRLVAFLALGATMTEHVYWAERLFHQVQELGVALDGEVNLDTVQIALIMISPPLGPV
ncbi:C6 transcription factor [Penicillium lividum]|nr:C6 transcription factor [Penicillium lividum]